jgi:5-methylcytosine-specific restriction endonuclease McrA
MKKSHQITLTPLSKESVPEPDFLVCKKCNVNKPKEAYRNYANKKAKIAESKKEKDMYGFF